MHTTRLQTVCASVATTRCHSWGSEVNKFEQVSSVGHQMSTAGGVYSEVQGIMGNGHMGTAPPGADTGFF